MFNLGMHIKKERGIRLSSFHEMRPSHCLLCQNRQREAHADTRYGVPTIHRLYPHKEHNYRNTATIRIRCLRTKKYPALPTWLCRKPQRTYVPN